MKILEYSNIMVKERRIDDDRIQEMHAELCKMLSHPTRLKILEQLKEGEKTVNEMVETLNINQSTVSQHLGELKKRDLVRAERDGSKMRYHITYPEIMKACDIIREVLFKQLSENQKLLNKGEKNG
ncbi:MAG: winged helix-turn-helix transcriptional regulator [Candidatus Thermoplasmatota archaeon]|nr:winged helix-turn-helix transcriptional regulator [Candidatus Thermoplasmatota archaeon]